MSLLYVPKEGLEPGKVGPSFWKDDFRPAAERDSAQLAVSEQTGGEVRCHHRSLLALILKTGKNLIPEYVSPGGELLT